jgi:hypothetical protein
MPALALHITLPRPRLSGAVRGPRPRTILLSLWGLSIEFFAKSTDKITLHLYWQLQTIR